MIQMTQKLKLTFEVTFCKSTLCGKLLGKKKRLASNLSGWKREWIGPLIRILRIQSVRDTPRADWVFFLDVVIVTNVKFLYFYCIESWSEYHWSLSPCLRTLYFWRKVFTPREQMICACETRKLHTIFQV